MEHMSEEDFAKLPQTANPNTCKHQIVKLYDAGSNTDYGCKYCKMMSTNKDDFTNRESITFKQAMDND